MVYVYLSSRGRRDITRDAFDQGEPVALDIGVPISDSSLLWSSQPVLRTVTHRAEGTCLLIGPGLIGRRQDLCFGAITDRPPSGRLTCQASLIDVRVRRQFFKPELWMTAIPFVAGFTFYLVYFSLVGLLIDNGIKVNLWLGFIIGFIGFAVSFTWMYMRKRKFYDTK